MRVCLCNRLPDNLRHCFGFVNHSFYGAVAKHRDGAFRATAGVKDRSRRVVRLAKLLNSHPVESVFYCFVVFVVLADNHAVPGKRAHKVDCHEGSIAVAALQRDLDIRRLDFSGVAKEIV